MDYNRGLFTFNKKIIAGTPVIEVPNKMVFITKAGKFKEVPTLTRTNNISMRNKKKVIKFVPIEDDIIKIKNKGYSKSSLGKSYLNEINKKSLSVLERDFEEKLKK